MKEFGTTITIHSPPETIWKYLTDAGSYPDWDPGMDRVEGKIAMGEKLNVYTKLSPDRTFPVKVTEFVPNQKMTWTGGMPLGLFKGVRTFTLTPKSEGITEFTTREKFSGLLFPLFSGTIPDLSQSFEDFASGLKKVSESA